MMAVRSTLDDGEEMVGEAVGEGVPIIVDLVINAMLLDGGEGWHSVKNTCIVKFL